MKSSSTQSQSKDPIFPLIKNFKSTTVWKAFALNAFASALVIIVSLVTKDALDRTTAPDGTDISRKQTWYSIVVTACVAFIASYAAFTAMHLLTGYGGGMLVDTGAT